jgi:hypothetical protein
MVYDEKAELVDSIEMELIDYDGNPNCINTMLSELNSLDPALAVDTTLYVQEQILSNFSDDRGGIIELDNGSIGFMLYRDSTEQKGGEIVEETTRTFIELPTLNY